MAISRREAWHLSRPLSSSKRSFATLELPWWRAKGWKFRGRIMREARNCESLSQSWVCNFCSSLQSRRVHMVNYKHGAQSAGNWNKLVPRSSTFSSPIHRGQVRALTCHQHVQPFCIVSSWLSVPFFKAKGKRERTRLASTCSAITGLAAGSWLNTGTSFDPQRPVAASRTYKPIMAKPPTLQRYGRHLPRQSAVVPQPIWCPLDQPQHPWKIRSQNWHWADDHSFAKAQTVTCLKMLKPLPPAWPKSRTQELYF